MMKNKQPGTEDTIMEEREDFMLSFVHETHPTLRTAHFLKPISNSIEEQYFQFNPSSSSSFLNPNDSPLKINFTGWCYSRQKWVYWVDQLKPKYESVWKKVGIFDAILSTKCHIIRDQNLLYGVVEKWCCETNTFVFPFGEATITLEDVMVLRGYPVLGDPVFVSHEDQEMREIEKKMILARQTISTKKQNQARATLWMDIFIDKGSEIEHEAFLATWLSIFVFPHKLLVKLSLFPIVVHLARGNPIALAPAVLASLYKDLSVFKKTIVDLNKNPVGGDKYPLQLTLRSPFYLLQIWAWERFKNLQPQPMSINHGDPLVFRWHKVKPLRINDVRLALDAAICDFLWRPYVRYANMCGMFYPNEEILVPFKKDLVDQQMLSFVICLRVSELVGIDSTEQYLPHRVAMQFGMDQDVPSDVPRFNEIKTIAWKNYCRRISHKNLYFPSRFFEAGVTARYARWWKQLVLGRNDFLMQIVKQKRSAISRKQRTCLGKANRSGNDVSDPPGFPPNLTFGKFCDDGYKTKTRKVDEFYVDVPYENVVHNCLKADEYTIANVKDGKPLLEEFKCGDKIHESKHLLNQCCSSSSAYYENILPLKRPISVDNIELLVESLDEVFEDANGSKEARISGDRVCLSETQGEIKSKSKSFSIRKKVSTSNEVTVAQHHLQFLCDMAAQTEAKESLEEIERERKESDHEVMVFLKEQYLKNQEELGRLARKQEEMLWLMELREKKDEELRQLVTSALMNNQQPPSSAS